MATVRARSGTYLALQALVAGDTPTGILPGFCAGKKVTIKWHPDPSLGAHLC